MKGEKEKTLNMNTFKFIFSHCGCANTKAIERIAQTAAAAEQQHPRAPTARFERLVLHHCNHFRQSGDPGSDSSIFPFFLGYTKLLMNTFIY